MVSTLVIVVSVIAATLGLPIEELNELKEGLLEEDSDVVGLDVLSPHIETDQLLETSDGLETSLALEDHAVIDGAKGATFGAALLPLKVSSTTKAVGAAVPAVAAVKGTAFGSAIATPIIVKAVALPGLAAGKTAALLATPKLFASKLHSVPQLVTHNLQSTILESDLVHNLADLVLVEGPEEGALEHDFDKELKVGVAKGALKFAGIVGLLKKKSLGLKAGAVGLATKGLLVVKKGALKAGKLLLKPILIITGLNLKAIGTGLTLGGKLIGGTGVKVAKTGTAIKYAGLAGIGMGASAISWGLDKSTFGTDLKALHADQEIDF